MSRTTRSTLRALTITAAISVALLGTAAPGFADPNPPGQSPGGNGSSGSGGGAGQGSGNGSSNAGAGNNNAGGNGNGNGSSNAGAGNNNAGGNGNGSSNAGAGNNNGNGNNNAGGNGNGNGNGNAGQGEGGNGSTGDPAGNNGTVKIASLGSLDSVPNNTPHPGCTFQVEWYGFDEGSDVVSTVSFAMHSPTADVGLTVDGPSRVFVGGDPASGAGTPTGIDGREAYTLSFDGAPHPKQGYHVKLTVATPRSRGNDTKTKVFWVEPCATAPTGSAPTGSTPDEPVADAETGAVLGASGTREGEAAETGVAGRPLASDAEVPSTIDAGAAGEESDTLQAVSSPAGLLTVALGLLAAAGAVVLRRRSRA